MVTGFLSIIPYVGFSFGFTAALITALANSEGSGALIGIAVVYGVVQFLESFIITPRIVGDKVGLTPFEAVTFGTPVLMSKQSGAAEVLRNCLTVDYWDVHEMANQMCAVIDNPALAKTLYDNSAEELKTLTWEPSIKKLLAVYDQEIARPVYG